MQANSPQLLFSVKIVAPLSTAKCSSVCKTLDANDPFHCVNMNGIDSETYSDLILLLDEQFKFENKHHEDAKQHLDTFLKEVTHSSMNKLIIVVSEMIHFGFSLPVLMLISLQMKTIMKSMFKFT
ncbi:hypothetical protein C9374_002611 [Naegleria lovaniensis]|uniref:Uncharacterized protein n=1 Tax=Naegleria lovaniensis TaxID=51637 RepID=A0AA88GNT0_NAELO|nr:uncharacterized protein C9374_002611 [Naegleria lovaniensis]KAG2386165.1 hypothetical protein C9374_002611 [Naegleria lovaniensis]